MKKQRWAIIVLASVAALSACSSSASNETSGTTDGTTPDIYVPEGNGTRIDENSACTMLTDARMAAAKKLKCPITDSVCPGYMLSGQTPACSQWDELAIQGCVSFYGSFTACSDFTNHKCQPLYFKDSAPNGCAADAATDSQTDGSMDGSDAGMDSAQDAASELDGETEGSVDAATDAVGE